MKNMSSKCNLRDEAGYGVPAALLAAVTDCIEAQCGQGRVPTLMDGVRMCRAFQEIMRIRRMHRPSLCVVIRGACIREAHIDTWIDGYRFGQP